MACAKVTLIVLNGFFALIALALIISSSIAMAQSKWMLTLVGIIAGVFVLLTNMLGMVGSPAGEKPGRRPVLMFYFFLTFLSVLFLALVGGVLFVSRDLLVGFVLDHKAEFMAMTWFKDFKGDDAAFVAFVADVLSKYSIIVASISIGLGVLLILGLLLSGYILSLRTVIKMLLGFQNLITLLCGLALVGTGVYGFVTPTRALGGAWVSIILLILGSVVALISALGFCGACVKNRCPLITYSVLMGLIIIFCAAIAIAVFAFLTRLLDLVKANLKLLREWFPDWKDLPDDQFVAVVQEFCSANFKVIAVISLIFGLFLIWSLIAAIYLATRIGKGDDKSSLLAHQELDINYALASPGSAYGGAGSAYGAYGSGAHSAYASAGGPSKKRAAQTFY